MTLPPRSCNYRRRDEKKGNSFRMQSIPHNLSQCLFDFEALSTQPVKDVVLQINSEPPLKTKYCAKGNHWLPATTDYWYRNKSNRDGFGNPCKSCQRDKHVSDRAYECIRCHACFAAYYSLCNECYQWAQDNKVKYCSDCELWLPTSRFGKRGITLKSRCISCSTQYQDKRRRQIVSEDHSICCCCASHKVKPGYRVCERCFTNSVEYKKQMLEQNPNLCHVCYAQDAVKGVKCGRCHSLEVARRSKDREQVFAVYGDKCVHCGETNIAFLTVDHVNNDGAEHRRSIKNGNLRIWLRKNNFPDGFQILCNNCNWLKFISSIQSGKDIYQKRYRDKIRYQVFDVYGKTCSCCGEDRLEVLTIDHVNGGGNNHRREVGAGSSFYKWLHKNGFPKGDYRTLCRNCNQAKHTYGTCPHQSVTP